MRKKYFVAFNAIIELGRRKPDLPEISSVIMNTIIDAEEPKDLSDIRVIEQAICKQVKDCSHVTLMGLPEEIE